MRQLFRILLLLLPGVLCAQIDDVFVTLQPKAVFNGAYNPPPAVSFSVYPIRQPDLQTEWISVSSSTEPSPNQLNLRMVPGVDYIFQFHINYGPNPPRDYQGFVNTGISKLIIPGVTIPGYKLQISAVERETGILYMPSKLPVPPDGVQIVSNRLKLIPDEVDTGLRAGAATSLSTLGPWWRLSLGALSNGKPAGSLVFGQSPGSSNFLRDLITPYNPADGNQSLLNLWTDASSSEVKIIKFDAANYTVPNWNAIKQIVAPQVVLDITQISATQVRIDCYHRSHSSPPAGLPTNQNAYTHSGPPTYYTFGGNTPFATYTMSINESGADTIDIRHDVRDTTSTAIGGIARTLVTSMERSGSTLTAYAWRVDGAASAVISSRLSAATWDTFKTMDANDVVAGQRTINYLGGSGALARQIASEVEGATGTVQRIYAYHDLSNPNSPSFGKVKGTTVTNGSQSYGWRGLEYNADGTIGVEHRPFKNSSFDLPTDLSNHTGLKTVYSYAYDTVFNWFNRITETRSTINGVIVKRSVTEYTEPNFTGSGGLGSPSTSVTTSPALIGQGSAFPYNQYLGLVTAVQREYSGAGASLNTTTRYFTEAAGSIANESIYDDFFRGQPFSVTKADETRESYVYERGDWSEPNNFMPWSTPWDRQPYYFETISAATRTTVIRGTVSTGTPYSSHNGLTIEAVHLVAGKSTSSVTIRDAYARVVRTESYIWSGTNWELVSWVNSRYNLANQLTSRTNSTNTSYSAVYSGDRLISETGDDGVTTTYVYDNSSGRVSSKTRSGVTTSYSYDAAGRVLVETISGANPADGVLTTTRQYDDAGRLKTEALPGRGTTTHAYDVGEGTHTISYPTGGSTIEKAYADGQVKSLTGTATVDQYFDYGVEASDGLRYTIQSTGSESSSRWKKSWKDWLDREVKATAPDPAVLNQSSPNGGGIVVTTTRSFDSQGRLSSLASTGKSATLYEYDEFSRVKREGLDVDNTGGLSASSLDRISDFTTVIERIGSDWWSISTTKTYPFPIGSPNSSTAVTSSVVRKRLSGFGSNVVAETETTDIDGNTSNQTTTQSGTTTTVRSTAPGVLNASVATLINGLTISVLDYDGLTTSTTYDSLQRPKTVTDERGNTTTTSYHSNSTLVASVTDALGNSTTYGYDAAGRQNTSVNPQGHTTYTAYNARNQVVRQWGAGTYPVEYGYDNYGQKTRITTYRSNNAAAWLAAAWPTPAPTGGDSTIFTYDNATGVLVRRTDASNRSVAYTYTHLRQTATVTSARNLVTTLGYDGATSDLLTTTYSDSTPGLVYTYSRTGQVASVTDSTGLRTLSYDSSKPWRVATISFSGFYGSRTLSVAYEAVTDNSAGTVNGRQVGYDVGSEFRYRDVYSNLGRLKEVRTSTQGGADQVFAYTYASDGLPSGYSLGSFQQSKAFEPKRNLPTQIKAQWGASIVTQFDYAYNSLGLRRFSQQSGSAFSDYGSVVYRASAFNSRGELLTSAMYGGLAPGLAANPPAQDELPGRRYEFRYDDIGNRVSAGQAGSVAGGDASYTTNSLNQYSEIGNTSVRILGATSPGVQLSGSSSDGQTLYLNAKDSVFGGDLVPALPPGPLPDGTPAQEAPLRGTLTVTGTMGGTTLSQSRPWYFGGFRQKHIYDEDGNLVNDGIYTYTYDAENRLTRIVTRPNAAAAGYPNRTVEFGYDYLGRRTYKRVTAGSAVETRYLYDGWNLVAEIDGTNASLKRTFSWGLDITGSLTATGGIGALLQIWDGSAGGKRLLPTYDANGNVAALVNAANGTTEAVYEYGPYGDLNRIKGDYAAANPFRFSTKYQDRETDLLYYGHRYYSSTLGRFINRDPIAEEGGLNLYGFAANDPIDRWDYLGQNSPTPGAVTAGGGSTAWGPSGYTQMQAVYTKASSYFFDSHPSGAYGGDSGGFSAGNNNDTQETKVYRDKDGKVLGVEDANGKITLTDAGKKAIGQSGGGHSSGQRSSSTASSNQGKSAKDIARVGMQINPDFLDAIKYYETQGVDGATVGRAYGYRDALGGGVHQWVKAVQEADRKGKAKAEVWNIPNPGESQAQFTSRMMFAFIGSPEGSASFQRAMNMGAFPLRIRTPVDRVRNVAQRSFDYAVQNPRKAGLNRMQLGKDAEVQATRWLRKWAERNAIDMGPGGLQFQVRGARSIPDIVYDPAQQIFDFKLTPKAVRPSQTRNFGNDFPGYNIDYIFGPGPWR